MSEFTMTKRHHVQSDTRQVKATCNSASSKNHGLINFIRNAVNAESDSSLIQRGRISGA